MSKVISAYEWWKENYPDDFEDNNIDCSQVQEYAEYYHKNIIDWEELHKKYEDWYLTQPRSWQECLNVFKWMREQIEQNQ